VGNFDGSYRDRDKDTRRTTISPLDITVSIECPEETQFS